jgi:hypothetical protein
MQYIQVTGLTQSRLRAQNNGMFKTVEMTCGVGQVNRNSQLSGQQTPILSSWQVIWPTSI